MGGGVVGGGVVGGAVVPGGVVGVVPPPHAASRMELTLAAKIAIGLVVAYVNR